LDPSELDRTDRILLGACAGIWLVALGAGVAAVVALVELGRGHADSSGESGAPWLLYTVIGVSALVIVAAVPLLLRARRTALEETPSRPQERYAPTRTEPAVPGVEAPTEKIRISGTTTAPPLGPRSEPSVSRAPGADAQSGATAAIDQIWLRCAVVIACAIGVAMIAIGVATYLMAVDSTVGAWVFLVLTGLVTVGMPAIPWFYLRELRELLGHPAAA
jgi:hypothetical protein